MITHHLLQPHRPILSRLVIASLCAGWLGLSVSAGAQSDFENYTFTGFAGPSESPASLDGTAQEARFSNAFGGAIDSVGNLYVADRLNHTIRRISSAAVVTTLAGLSGQSGSADGAGSAARFDNPCAVARDSAGNVYVTDTFNHTIRKISPAGVVTTLAGVAGLSGTNNGTGSEARFNSPTGIALDTSGNLYVADQGNSAIRKMTPDGAVTTFAGLPGTPGSEDGTGTAARFSFPFGLAVDNAGNVFVADSGNHVIRKITPAGVVTSFAGSAGVAGSVNGAGTKARFNSPFAVAVDSAGKLCVADTYNHILRAITSAGVVSALAGTAGEPEASDGTGSSARFRFPTGVVFDNAGNVFAIDFGNSTVRKVTPAGIVTTFAGVAGSLGTADGTSAASRFNYPADVAVDAAGNTYVADYSSHTIRKISPAGVVTTFAGKAGVSGTANGSGGSARFNGPVSIAVDARTNIFVSDSENNTIRRITPAGAVTTLAGSAGVSGTNDDTGNKARFFKPYGIAVDNAGNVFVADTWNHAIRKITPAGVVTTLAGKAGTIGTNDGTGTGATFYYPAGLEVNTAGNLFVADGGNHTVRKITAAGEVTTMAGTAGEAGSADGVGAAARFRSPFGLALNSVGEIFIGDLNNNLIRKVTPEGKVTTLGGTTLASGAGNGTGAEARFFCPEGLVVRADGALLVADACNHAIRRGAVAPPDAPTVDLPVERPGVIRHMDVTNLTTSAWTWRIIRYPSASTALLSSTTVRNPTFTPDQVDLYRIRLEGTDDSGRRTIRTIEIEGAELNEPRFDTVGVSAGNVILTGSGGTPGSPFTLLWSTNASLPSQEWSIVSGNRFDNQGSFALTNEMSLPENYYRIRVP